jgi:MmyB-like transcription regulator ligand binding domain
LRANSDRIAERWDPAPSAATRPRSKTIDHPHVGILTLGHDVLTVAQRPAHRDSVPVTEASAGSGTTAGQIIR